MTTMLHFSDPNITTRLHFSDPNVTTMLHFSDPNITTMLHFSDPNITAVTFQRPNAKNCSECLSGHYCSLKGLSLAIVKDKFYCEAGTQCGTGRKEPPKLPQDACKEGFYCLAGNKVETKRQRERKKERERARERKKERESLILI